MWLLIVVLAVASRPIEIRLWRAGRLSDRSLTLLVLGRSPIFMTIVAIGAGLSLPVSLLLVAASLIPLMTMYRYVLGIVQEHSRARHPD